MKNPIIRAYIAEFIGAFALTLAVALSLLTPLGLPTPVIAALTLGIFVYTVGQISGAHLNPAISIGMMTIGKLSWKNTLLYVIFQIAGACLALVCMKSVVGEIPQLVFGNTWDIGIGEAFGAFFLAMGVAAATFEKVTASASGLVVGGSLLLGILIASGVSLGVLNPAVAIGLGGSGSFTYLLSPIVGAIVGAQLYNVLQKK